MKKGDISIQVIIIAVICLVVLAVLIIIFAIQSGKFSGGVNSCTARQGACGTISCSGITPPNTKTCGTEGVFCAAIPGTDCKDKYKGTKEEYCCVPLTDEKSSSTPSAPNAPVAPSK